MKTDIQALFLDLDGTLLDTARDLANASNEVLRHHGFQTQPLRFIRTLISGGVSRIIHQSCGLDANHLQFHQMKQQILQSYQQKMTEHTTLFTGMHEVLSCLQRSQTPWGIVTNKPCWLAEPLLDCFKFDYPYACLVARDSSPYAKPHPLPLLYACQLLRVTPRHCAYVGDAENDIIAAKKAGMLSIAANYGYLGPDDQVTSWQADYIVQSPLDLLNLLRIKP